MKKRVLLTLIGCSIATFAQPSVVSLTPLNGPGANVTFTAVYRHSGGVNQTYLSYLLVLPTPNIVWFTATGSCLVEYNRISNGMRLINDAGNGWLGGQSGVPVGAGGTTLSNSYCSVNTAAVTAALGGTDVTLTVPLSFKTSLSGALATFLQELDVNGVWTGMTQFGNWTSYVTTQAKPGPYIGLVSIPDYSLFPTSVDLFSGHTGGISNLYTVNILLSDTIVGGAVRCHIIYFGQTKAIKLVNDEGTDFVTNSPQQNSTCAIGSFNGDLMYASGSGNEVHLHIPMLYNPDLVKSKIKVWFNTFDTAGNLTHWHGAQ